MKRPIGVIFTVIVLGLMAALQLLFAGLMGIGAVVVSGSQMNGPQPPFIIPLIVGMSIFLAILSGWAIATLVGLVRLRNWARWSILVIAGCMLALSLVSVAGTAMVAAVMPGLPATPSGPAVPAHTMHIVLLFEALFYVFLGLLAGWWLVYFNLRSTVAYFLPAYRENLQLEVGTVPQPGRFAAVPVPVLIVAALFLLCALLCLPYLFVPLPVFFLGFTFERPASTLFFVVMLALLAWIAVGLARLENRARLAVFALIGLGAINFGVFLTPWCQARFAAYYSQLMTRMNIPPNLQFPVPSPPMIIFSMVFALAIYALMAWPLQHYRRAFLEPPLSPSPQSISAAR